VGGELAGEAGVPPGTAVVTAPIIGVFYRASAPGTDPFVEVGTRVEQGQTLCILEAMKLMNEIASDYRGTVTRILAENGALVSLGEPLFWIEQ
jgi:acetyl-CoA carboxylase biotin carboxyl carrier protein